MNFQTAIISILNRMVEYPCFWCVAGGWAIDLYLGKQTRPHDDIEIVALRTDYKTLFTQLNKYNPQKIINDGTHVSFLPWDGTEIEADCIQLSTQTIRHLEHEYAFDVLLTPSRHGKWVCRRNENIVLPFNDVIISTPHHIPILRQEIVLLFKAKYVREKDCMDYENVIDTLNKTQKKWFIENLRIIHPNHDWAQFEKI